MCAVCDALLEKLVSNYIATENLLKWLNHLQSTEKVVELWIPYLSFTEHLGTLLFCGLDCKCQKSIIPVPCISRTKTTFANTRLEWDYMYYKEDQSTLKTARSKQGEQKNKENRRKASVSRIMLHDLFELKVTVVKRFNGTASMSCNQG